VAELAATKIVLPGGRKVRLSTSSAPSPILRGAAHLHAARTASAVVAFADLPRRRARATCASRPWRAPRSTSCAPPIPASPSQLIDNTVELYTVGNYTSAMTTLLEGALARRLVVFLFLRDWRATVIAAVALPLSIIPTFWAMDMLGFSLNLVSLLAITS
jgi:hypothetical protein